MNRPEPQKLEMLQQFQRMYPGALNPDLLSIKYCQGENAAYLEMLFAQLPDIPEILVLDFISNDSEPAEVDGFPDLFNPDADIVDNARLFAELDAYSLINCVGGLFSDEAATNISDAFHKKRTQEKQQWND